MKAPKPVKAAKTGTAQSAILKAVHQSISGLHNAGVVSLETMREFDALCWSSMVEPVPEQ